ncbi:MAG: hypothetical protein ACXWR1_17155 [Bdellovibrionota bacterium]
MGVLLLLLLSLPSHAMDEQGFRKSDNIIDERESSAKKSYQDAATAFEISRKNLTGVGKMATTWVAECDSIKPFKNELAEVNRAAAASPPLEKIFPASQAGVFSGVFSKEDLAKVDSCTGAVDTQKNAVSKGVALLSDSESRFTAAYNDLSRQATRLGGDILLVKTPPEKNPKCTEMKRKIFKAAMMFHSGHSDLLQQFHDSQEELRLNALSLKPRNCDKVGP